MTPQKIAAELVALNHHDARMIARIAKATTKLALLRAAQPGCLIHVFGPWDSTAYYSGTPDAAYTNLSAAIQAGCAGIMGVWFHSMQGVAFEPVGGGDIHPNQNGHNALYAAMYAKIATVHGLRALA